MVKLQLALGLVVLVVWVFAVVDVVISDEGAIRRLPKLPWLLLVLFFPLAGSVAWLLAGRPRGAARPRAHERPAPQFPEYDRPGRAAATSAEDDEAFLRQVRERAEEQRRAYEQRRRAEQAKRAEAGDEPEA